MEDVGLAPKEPHDPSDMFKNVHLGVGIIPRWNVWIHHMGHITICMYY